MGQRSGGTLVANGTQVELRLHEVDVLFDGFQSPGVQRCIDRFGGNRLLEVVDSTANVCAIQAVPRRVQK